MVEENTIDVGLDAAELARLRTRYSHTQGSHSDSTHRTHPRRQSWLCPMLDSVYTFWTRQFSVTVAHEACRDHLALERTFLAYLRTSLALSSLGVAVAQLFRLQHSPTPSPVFGFYVLGKPLACICQGAAIYCLILGAYRSWRLQNAIVRGKAITGGFEIIFLGLGMVVIAIVFLALIIAVDIDKEF